MQTICGHDVLENCTDCGKPFLEVAAKAMSPIGHDLYPTMPNGSIATLPDLPLANFIATTVQALQAAAKDMDALHQRQRALEQRLAELLGQPVPLGAGRARQESVPGDVARQPDPRRDHDLAHRPVSTEPFAGAAGEVGEFHGGCEL